MAKTRKKKLTKTNYHSPETNLEYMSCSQFKDFAPAFGGCEAGALAKLKGEYEEKEKEAYVEGRFVHAWNEGRLDQFKKDNPDLFSTKGASKGELKSNYQHCEKMIEVLESDPLVMKALSGQKEVVMIAELFGTPWKIMIDSYNPELGIFADLKALRGMEGKYWNNEAQCYENFIQHYGYDMSLAIYAEVERLAMGRGEYEWLVPHMVVVTKQDPPNHEIIYFDEECIMQQLVVVGHYIERVKQVKSGKEEPVRCERCEYCRSTKKITRVKHYAEFNLY